MLKPLRLAICLIVAPAVLASGCGSSKTTTTHTTASTAGATGTTATAGTSATTSTPATTGTPARKSPPAGKRPPAAKSPAFNLPASIPGISPKQAQHFKEAREVQHQLAVGRLTKGAAKAKREHIERVLENERLGKLGTEAIRARVPSRRQFPTEVQRMFVTGCTSAKRSIFSCECILAKFEEGRGKKETEKENKATKALRIGEALYTEARIRLHERLPPRVEGFVKECAHA